MPRIDDFSIPVDDHEKFLMIQNIRILKGYQNDIRKWVRPISELIPLVKAKNVKPLVEELYLKNDQVRQTVLVKNRFYEELKSWENGRKISMINRLGAKNQVEKLMKIAAVLSAVKNRTN